MADFYRISTRTTRNGTVEIYPKFIIGESNDVMIRGGDFYAVWLEELGMWSTREQDVINLIDRDLDAYAEELRKKDGYNRKVLHMWDAETGIIDRWHTYCQRQQRDVFHTLDETLIFSNTKVRKQDYSSKRLSYPLEPGSIDAYDKLMSTLYAEEERHKIEWAIGSIVTGDSKTLQKFLVLYGAAGTGKSTVLNIIQQLFDGYYAVFDAKSLGSGRDQFALEAFKNNPLVAIQHDGDLSKIEDNTILNSLVSHEQMMVNEKHKSRYPARFLSFLFMGTNKPVKITDGKSGIIRRLIDVTPSGNKLTMRDYRTLTKQIPFELGAIACHCRDVYLEDPHYYDDYIPTAMFGASNDFYNFVIDSYHVFRKEDSTTLKGAWEMYKTYCDYAKVAFPLSQRAFKEELKNYFWEFNDRFNLEDGSRVRSHYSGFRTDKFEQSDKKKKQKETHKTNLIQFVSGKSIFDHDCSDCLAQYATVKETPFEKWEQVTTKLSDLDTSKLHYVKVPENHIVIDFDIKDADGKKSFEKNIEEASKWPPTYAELSKSGGGIHLHYIYDGDVTKLSRIYDDNIEVKVFTGGQSLRRKLTKCNNLPTATINSGLPLKGDKMINTDVVKTEKGIRTLIKRNLNKEYHPGTKPSIDFIYKILEDNYNDGTKYDVSDLKNDVFAFAANSTNHATYCIKLVNKMKFKSEEPSEPVTSDEAPIAFYDVEVFPNLFLVNWKLAGEEQRVVRMINPSPSDIEGLLRYRLIGFNNRRYDNHMLYARLMGYTTEQLYELSQKIIKSPKGEGFKYLFAEAYNLSYTDVYDFASARNKKSLKKLEIEMGIHHKELGLPWDKPVPEELWIEVAEYCDWDVIATEKAFHYLKGDWMARKILADIAGMSVNDSTNALSQRIIFGNNRKPQNEFNYRNLALPVGSDQYEEYLVKFGEDYRFRVFNEVGLPEYRDYIPGEVLPEGWSILPFFLGYKFEGGKSTYLDEEIGEGGRVYGEPGMYADVWDGDVTGQHPSSIIAEVYFGPRYTAAFKAIVDGRVSIKHQAWSDIDNLFDGKLKPYIKMVIDGELTAKELADALKTVVNAVYGQTAASYSNPLRDNRNKDNIIAKRGALFMTLLKSEVQKLGYKVCHIKTDSIKIPNADQKIIDFVLKFGKEFGYSFETEAEFDRFCLTNNAVYIARTKDGKWTATGAQFAVPYVFKKLFSKEPIEFEDLCETKEVKSALYLDLNEKLPEGEHDYVFVGKVGLFCPIKPGCGGGVLLRQAEDKDGNIKYDSATGADGYRWLEAEMVRDLGKEADVDRSYYDALVDAAIYGKKTKSGYIPGIADFGDFEWFVSDDKVEEPIFKSDITDLPWCPECGEKESCLGCPNLSHDEYHMKCKKGFNINDLKTFNKI